MISSRSSRLHRPRVWRVPLQRQVSPVLVVVREVPGENVSQVALAKDDEVVEALPADRADRGAAQHQVFCQGACGAMHDFLHCHPTHPAPEPFVVEAWGVENEMGSNRFGTCPSPGAVVGFGMITMGRSRRGRVNGQTAARTRPGRVVVHVGCETRTSRRNPRPRSSGVPSLRPSFFRRDGHVVQQDPFVDLYAVDRAVSPVVSSPRKSPMLQGFGVRQQQGRWAPLPILVS